MDTYICPNCHVDFGYPQGLAIHEELGCQWGDDEDDGAQSTAAEWSTKRANPPASAAENLCRGRQGGYWEHPAVASSY